MKAVGRRLLEGRSLLPLVGRIRRKGRLSPCLRGAVEVRGRGRREALDKG